MHHAEAMQPDTVGSVRALHTWFRRAAPLVPVRDAVQLLSPPILIAKFFRYALAGHKRDLTADDPNQRDPAFVGLVMDLARALGRHYFRLELRGVGNIPADGPALLVGNHNGGFLPIDTFFTALAVWDRFGPSRAIYTLAHDFLFHDPTLRRYALRLGSIRASEASARKVFERGGIVLVYPGSDLDAFRPWRDRSRVVLGGRKGFIRLALSARVPVVPVVSVGTHEQMIVLTRGDRLAQLLHMHAWTRATVCPIVLSVPWGITSGFVPYLPLPAQTTVAFGPAITWSGLSPSEAQASAVIDRCYAEVEARMQSLLDELAKGRRPFLGQTGPASVLR